MSHSDWPPPDYTAAEPARRCLKCDYVLNHLPEQVCPECGTHFRTDDPTSWTTKPRFVRWRYWLPAFLMVTGLALLIMLVLVPLVGFEWAATLAIPAMFGALIGYGARLGDSGCLFVAFLAIAAVFLGLAANGAKGVFNGLILFAVAVVPLSIGALLGVLLREMLRTSRWEQRHWLPVLWMVIWVLIAPAPTV